MKQWFRCMQLEKFLKPQRHRNLEHAFECPGKDDQGKQCQYLTRSWIELVDHVTDGECVERYSLLWAIAMMEHEHIRPVNARSIFNENICGITPLWLDASKKGQVACRGCCQCLTFTCLNDTHVPGHCLNSSSKMEKFLQPADRKADGKLTKLEKGSRPYKFLNTDGERFKDRMIHKLSKEEQQSK